jgi:dienelactone hydrolase
VISKSTFTANSKPEIDTSILKDWPSVVDGDISSDDNFASYTVRHEPIGGSTLVIKYLKGSWEVEFPSATHLTFTNDSRLAIFHRHDSVGLLNLVDKHIDWLPAIQSYEIFGHGGNQYIIYSLKEQQQQLLIRNLSTDKEYKFVGVKAFLPYKDGRNIFVTLWSKDNNHQITQMLAKIDVGDFKLTPIWAINDSVVEINVHSVAFDERTGQVAFSAHFTGGTKILYYNGENNKSVLIADDSISKLDSGVEIADIDNRGFSEDGKRLFINLQRKKYSMPIRISSSVDIWNYKDQELQSEQLYQIDHPDSRFPQHFVAVVDIGKFKVIRLNFNNEDIALFNDREDSLALVTNWGNGNFAERNWNPMAKFVYYLESTKTGIRYNINKDFAFLYIIDKYLYGADSLRQYYYIYDVTTHTYNNVSKSFPLLNQLDEDYYRRGLKGSGVSVAGWMASTNSLIMYDRYDIWEVDPLGRKPAIDITRGYGRSHHIALRFIGIGNKPIFIERSKNYILYGFDEITKEHGFFSFCINDFAAPKKLTMGPYCYELVNKKSLDASCMELVDSAIYVVRRQSASQSPNYFYTTDFKSFTPISFIYPETKYNWLCSEVIRWRTSDKKGLFGVLYKPGNFDPTRKYPVIINYYETLSQHAYEYQVPELSINNINIPWFVSRGYIVFQPDIIYTIGEPGKSAYDCITSGTLNLMKYRWINPKRIAIQGHSWGGYETNYLVTHSKLYAAAVSASSITDFVSAYGMLKKGGLNQMYYEEDQGRMGTRPWDRPDLYVKNSPIFFADRVSTPLLLISNHEDSAVPFSQAIELYGALRRLHKRVWMLQYDGERHSILRPENQVDYTIRMTQFFDHYLKNAPAPKWMTIGIPARLKGIDNGFEFDVSGNSP